MGSTAGKLISLEAAIEWRRSLSGRLVFTNGVFDLLHPGHVEYLEAARAMGDALLVALNTDRSARGLSKGTARPIVAEAARARVLAGLAAVDRVILFDAETPIECIAALKPDVLVKGGDYTRGTVVGADLVEAAGGTVAIIPLLSGFSTTSIVERCRAAT